MLRVWRQAMIWTNTGILLIVPLGTNFSELLITIHTFLFKRMHVKMLSGKWLPFCLSLDVLISPTKLWQYSLSSKSNKITHNTASLQGITNFRLFYMFYFIKPLVLFSFKTGILHKKIQSISWVAILLLLIISSSSYWLISCSPRSKRIFHLGSKIDCFKYA